ncbi:MAG: response regulator [Desulfovibrio sp.]|jgi:putative two-component system response regulator|nr:response regulator [Desulfovibrio sp.]
MTDAVKKILVVDDNIAGLSQINAYLSGSYAVSLAKSGEMALRICRTARPDLILLDIEMPGMDGFETIARLKKNQFTGSIPVIFLTGIHNVETEIKGLDAGARDFITKPVVKSVLLQRIELHLRFTGYQTYLENSVAQLSDSIASSFAEMIECRDENTGGHVMRTGKYVEMLADKMIEKGLFPGELTETDMQLIARSAPLHDIGKIAIGDAILLKPGKLNDEEFAAIKMHTVYGEQILHNMLERTPTQRYLHYARLTAFSHHERYDGKGYPEGLAGEEIPLCGRIMAVADVYDALVHDRVYRRSLSHEEACRIIFEGKNANFDGRVVETFESIHTKFAEMTEKMPA